MKVLALELSSSRGSVALLADNASSREFPNDRKDSGCFFAKLLELWPPNEPPDLIVVGLGPGSYAGVRIAISTAVGLAAASGAMLAGLPSITCLEVDAIEHCVIGDARRQSFFFARISNEKCAEGPQLYSDEELRVRLKSVTIPVVSSQALPQFPRVNLAFPSAAILAARARELGAAIASSLPLEPIYLREPHITSPRA